MALRCTVVIVALLLFAGEGVCSALCAPERSTATAAHAATPPCHQTAPQPEAPPAEHDCNGPCEATLTASGPELPSQASQSSVALASSPAAPSAFRLPARAAAAPERLPPGPARFLLHASFLI